jgi:Spy/CpxP family protein refolding chaperone
MGKIEAIVTLAFIVVSTMPALADDFAKAVKTAAPVAGEDTGSKPSDAPPATSGKKRHEHERGQNAHASKGHPHGKRQVMTLPDLTDKQKSQLQAIYDSKKAQFQDLRKQMNALEADEWQQVQGVLTPEQIDKLDGKKASADAGAGGTDSAKAPASK